MEDKKTVLAIDDNSMMLDLFQKMLSLHYNIEVVNSAANAIDFLNKKQTDLILLDIEMPNVSGFDFLYDIRKIPGFMKVPIIIVSGNTGQEFFQQARNSSAAGILTKPVKKEVLIEAIERALSMADQIR